MTRRLPALMQMFPQFNPWNIWDLSLTLWWSFARMADEWVAEQQKQEAAGRG